MTAYADHLAALDRERREWSRGRRGPDARIVLSESGKWSGAHIVLGADWAPPGSRDESVVSAFELRAGKLHQVTAPTGISWTVPEDWASADGVVEYEHAAPSMLADLLFDARDWLADLIRDLAAWVQP